MRLHTGRRLKSGWLFSAMLLGLCGAVQALNLAADGCPTFHCTIEATGAITSPVIPSVSTITSNTLGTFQKQGCSGDGTRLACLFLTDSAIGSAQGSLKVLDATTLQPI